MGYPEVTFEWLLGKAFMPLAWLMGVSWSECETVGTLLGVKTVANEFIAYNRLGTVLKFLKTFSKFLNSNYRSGHK